jgi:catechol 2,3-dioxygenase-like lactoylglutathione lyase family enzyme
VIRGLHHASRTVGNLDRSLGFYSGLLGLQVLSDEELEGAALDNVVGLVGARLRVVELSLNDAILLELIEYRSPKGQRLPASATPADVGSNHLALLVDDIHAAYSALASAGVRFTAPPTEIQAGGFAGTWTAYCFDPDGLTVELWQPSASEHVR